MSTPMRRASPNQFVEVRNERFEGAPVGERRRWSDEFKERAVAAAMAPDVNVSALARSLNVSPSQLFGWRRAAARRAFGTVVGSAGETAGERPQRVEIEVGDAVVRVAADIAEDDLRRLLRAVRRA